MYLSEIVDKAAEWVVSIYGPFHPLVKMDVVFDEDINAPFTAYPEPDLWNVVNVVLPVVEEPYQCYQFLTHELVHCLRPNGLPGFQATYLEEGLAEHSSICFLEANFSLCDENGVADASIWRKMAVQKDGKYARAFSLIEEVVRCEGLENMRQKVREIREAGLPLCAITPEIMAHYFTNTPHGVLIDLGRNFALD